MRFAWWGRGRRWRTVTARSPRDVYQASRLWWSNGCRWNSRFPLVCCGDCRTLHLYCKRVYYWFIRNLSCSLIHLLSQISSHSICLVIPPSFILCNLTLLCTELAMIGNYAHLHYCDVYFCIIIYRYKINRKHTLQLHHITHLLIISWLNVSAIENKSSKFFTNFITLHSNRKLASEVPL